MQGNSEIKNVVIKENLQHDLKDQEKFQIFQKLLLELKKHQLPMDVLSFINTEIESFNSFNGTEKDNRKMLKTTQTHIISKLEKDLKIVPKNHYRNLWFPLGMSAIGVPIGVIIGLLSHNMGLLGVGLPIGMGIGSIVGLLMDKKAMEQGKQLDVEIK